MGPLQSVGGEALARRGEEFGGEGEVALGSREVRMAQVGGQVRQEALDIRPRVVPRGEAPDREAVAKIV